MDEFSEANNPVATSMQGESPPQLQKRFLVRPPVGTPPRMRPSTSALTAASYSLGDDHHPLFRRLLRTAAAASCR
jgi:hypothetical protein